MTQFSLFGQDLSDYDIEILIDSGIQAEQWAQITRQLQAREAYGRRGRDHIIQVLKAAGLVGSALYGFANMAYERVSETGKRLRSDNNEVEEPQAKRQDIDTNKNFIPENTTEAAEMSGQSNGFVHGDGSGKEGNLSETPVDDVSSVHRGPPTYTFASLPYIEQGVLYVNQYSADLAMRLTSPYDVKIDQSTVDINAGTGVINVNIPQSDAGDSINTWNKARWFDFYASQYNYYHVISCKWEVMIENLTADYLWCHQMFYNDETPPNTASNQDMQTWAGTKSYLLGPQFMGVDNNNAVIKTNDQQDVNVETGPVLTGVNSTVGDNLPTRGMSSMASFGGTYSPGDFDREVRLDNQVENWTLVNSNPSLPERLLLRLKPYADTFYDNSANTYGRNIKVRYNIKMTYLVEFKELKMALRYPVNRQPMTVTFQSSGQGLN